jgi:hypothetical protein
MCLANYRLTNDDKEFIIQQKEDYEFKQKCAV